jgi:hypothetical protein
LPASYARDVFVPLVVLGASLSIAFESADHLFGGAVGVAL